MNIYNSNKGVIRRDKCDICVTDKSMCNRCKDNIKYRKVPKISYFTEYIPVCPFGTKDCVSDPAYIKHFYPDWYEEMYGDITPKEAIQKYCAKSPGVYVCYDNEDK